MLDWNEYQKREFNNELRKLNDAATKQGATKEEVIEALSVAVAVNAGAALLFPWRVMDAFEAKTEVNTYTPLKET